MPDTHLLLRATFISDFPQPETSASSAICRASLSSSSDRLLHRRSLLLFSFEPALSSLWRSRETIVGRGNEKQQRQDRTKGANGEENDGKETANDSYKPGYTAPPCTPDETTIDISGGWTITGASLDLRDPRILAMAAAQRHFFEAEYDDDAAANASGAAFCRSAALILLALLLLRHAISMNTEGDDDTSSYFSIFVMRAVGFLLPCYIMAWAINILHRRRQRQEAAAMAAAEVAFILQSGQGSSLQLTIAPESPATPQQEPHQ